MFGIPELSPAALPPFSSAIALGFIVGVIVTMLLVLYTAPKKDGTQRFRLMGWIVLAIVLVLLVAIIAPNQVPLLISKEAMVVVSGVSGFFFDRGIAPYARPDNPNLTPQERAAAGQRRAIIIAGFVIAGALGA